MRVALLLLALVVVGCGKPREEAAAPSQPVKNQDEVYIAENKADLTVAQLRATQPKDAVIVRVRIRLASYWNYAYKAATDTHYSFQIRGSASPDESVWIEKASVDGKRLYELCKDAKDHWVTLRIKRVGPNGEPTPPSQQGIAILSVNEWQ